MNSECRVVVRTGGRVVTDGLGRAIDLRGIDCDVDAEAILGAVEASHGAAEQRPVNVDAPAPGRWWGPLANPDDDTAPLDRLVVAARSRGEAPPELERLAEAERELARLSVESVDPTAQRRHLAEVGADVERLREEAATLRGRLQARRSVDADTDDVEAALAETMTALAEAETDQVAAEQAHAAAERRARDGRAARRRRLRLQDRVANRRRDARFSLVASVADAFERAVDSLPGPSSASLSTDPLRVTGDPVTAAFAALDVSDLSTPVVDPTDRFASAEAAAETLGVPVIRC